MNRLKIITRHSNRRAVQKHRLRGLFIGVHILCPLGESKGAFGGNRCFRPKIALAAMPPAPTFRRRSRDQSARLPENENQ